MTEEERKHALSTIRDKLSELAALQMASAREVSRIRLMVDSLVANAQAKWDEYETVRAELDRLLRDEKESE